jgi:hypothetical protein
MAAKKTKNKDLPLDEGHEVDPDKMHDQNVKGVAMKPSNRSEAMAMAVNLIASLKDDQALNCFADMVKQAQYEADEIANDLAAKNAASIAMKASDAAAKKLAEAAQEAIKTLFNGDEKLTEEFQQKAAAIFETQMAARVALAKEDLKEELEKEYDAKFEAMTLELVEKVDEVLAFATKQWMEDNKVAIESTLRTEATQEFIEALKNLFADHYIEIPDERIDVVEALVGKVDEITEQLNQVTNEKIELLKEKALAEKGKLVDDACKGLSVENADKLRSLCEDFEPNDQLEAKIKLVKEAHFKTKAPVKSNILTETFVPPKSEKKTSADPMIAAAVETLRTFKRQTT